MTHKDILTPGKPSLAFGCMRLPGEAETIKMMDTYLDSGYNYFDTAYAYGGSEEMLKKTLVKRHPRESYMIANKLPPWSLKKPKDCDKILKESLQRCGVDYFDFYLMHSLSDDMETKIEDLGMFEWAAEQKKLGLLKHVGFSFHGTTPYLKRLLDRHPETEFVMLQLNYLDMMQGQAGEWYNTVQKHNKALFVMEPVRGGSLANLPESAEALMKARDPNRTAASWALQFAANLRGVSAVLSGMSNMEQMQDNINTFKNLKPMTDDEYEMLEEVLTAMSKVASIACTACKYCHSYCPQGIDIAGCFSAYNESKRTNNGWNSSMTYNTIPKKADKCTGCGACNRYCPQKLQIPTGLAKVAKHFK